MKRIAVILLLLSIPLGVFAEEGLTPAASDPAREADDSRYDNAYQLYKLKRYDQALANLGEYIEVYDEGFHRKQALRIIGDIYLSRFDYTHALKYYSTLFEEYNTEEEGIGGYYQTGICYSHMGKTEKALVIFKAIIEQYPASGYAQKARTQLEIEELVK